MKSRCLVRTIGVLFLSASFLLAGGCGFKNKPVPPESVVPLAIEDLRYGSIVINNWGALAHYMIMTPWGGYPGSEIYDVQSGIGFVNNPLMFDRVQKSVIYSDFAPLADPFLANTSNNYLWYRQDARYHFQPSISNLFNLVWKALTIKKAKAPS